MIDMNDIKKQDNETPNQAAIRALACVYAGFKMGSILDPNKRFSVEEIGEVLEGVIEDIKNEGM